MELKKEIFIHKKKSFFTLFTEKFPKRFLNILLELKKSFYT